jgi:alpha-1,2-mannosyltransferase
VDSLEWNIQIVHIWLNYSSCVYFIILIAKVVHMSLNARGGAERLAVVTIKTLSSMGMDVELATMENPDMAIITEAYGESLGLSVKKISRLTAFPKNRSGSPDLTVNTHGDMLPYFREDFTKKNSIVYCHYPVASCQADRGDPAYYGIIHKMCLSDFSLKRADMCFSEARNAYRQMMLNSTVLTNSEFSRRAIFNEFGIDPIVLPPPVDVDTFRNAALSSDIREDSILVVSRFHATKKVENAVHLARLLKQKGIGKRVKIAGNISPNDAAYFSYLNDLVRRYGLEDFVTFEVNVKFERLLDLMRRSTVYFHPMPGEPFGISTVEAMSAGLIPVVPDIGGHTEFVPEKYQFKNLGQAVEAVAAALGAPASERLQLSHSTQKYSIANYIAKFSQIVAEVLGIGKPMQPAPVIFPSKTHSEQITRPSSASKSQLAS